jgi:hypothetical protein
VRTAGAVTAGEPTGTLAADTRAAAASTPASADRVTRGVTGCGRGAVPTTGAASRAGTATTVSSEQERARRMRLAPAVVRPDAIGVLGVTPQRSIGSPPGTL